MGLLTTIRQSGELDQTLALASGLLAIAVTGNECGARRTVIMYDAINGNICDVIEEKDDRQRKFEQEKPR